MAIVSIEQGKLHNFFVALVTAPAPPGTFISVDGANDWLSRYRVWYEMVRGKAIPTLERDDMNVIGVKD